MRVSEVMSEHPVTVRAEATATSALHLLSRNAVTALPVVDDRGRLVGIVSEADLLPGPLMPTPLLPRATPAHPASALQATAPASVTPAAPTRAHVGDVMTRSTVLVHPETDLFEVGRLLAQSTFKSLPVVDASHQVVGVISRSDLVRALARDDDTLAENAVDDLVRSGRRGFRVQVRNGIARVTSAPGASHEDVAAALSVVAATPGVVAVHAEPAGPPSREPGTFGPVGRVGGD